MTNKIPGALGVAALLSLAAGFDGTRPAGNYVPKSESEPDDGPERAERVARIRADAEERRRRRNATRLAYWRNGEAYEVRGVAEMRAA